jgi:hypothetical protein
MKMRTALLALPLVAWLAFLLGPGREEGAAPRSAGAPPAVAMAMQSSVPKASAAQANHDAGRAAVLRHADSRATARLPVRSQLVFHNDWKELFDHIEEMDSLPATEKLRYQAIILDACSHYERAREMEARRYKDRSLDEITEQMTANVRDARRRDAIAFQLQRRITNVCRGFAAESISGAEVNAAYAQAAAAGDPVGIARVIEQSSPQTLTPENRLQLVGSLFSGDPLAIRAAGRVLSRGDAEQAFRFGADGVDLGAQWEQTWTLAACQFGFECGPANMAVTRACAFRSQCAESYADYLRTYGLSAEDFARVDANARAIADAIRRRDTSAFQLVPQPGRNLTRYAGGLPPITIR